MTCDRLTNCCAVLRERFTPDVDPALYPPFVILKSVHNVVIEAFWHWLHEKTGRNLKDFILRGKQDGIFQPNVKFHWYELIDSKSLDYHLNNTTAISDLFYWWNSGV
jgi:hypothetical protein